MVGLIRTHTGHRGRLCNQPAITTLPHVHCTTNRAALYAPHPCRIMNRNQQCNAHWNQHCNACPAHLLTRGEQLTSPLTQLRYFSASPHPPELYTGSDGTCNVQLTNAPLRMSGFSLSLFCNYP